MYSLPILFTTTTAPTAATTTIPLPSAPIVEIGRSLPPVKTSPHSFRQEFSSTSSFIRQITMIVAATPSTATSTANTATPENYNNNKNNVGSNYNNYNSLDVKTQYQQMNDAMILKSLQGTKWRVVQEGSKNSIGPDKCITSYVTFQGFADEPNRGSAKHETCVVDGSSSTYSIGRWISKPSEIRRGAVELSARWKVKIGNEKVIYRGFIRTDFMISSNGKINAEMTGTILSADDDKKTNVVLGKFRADLIDTNAPAF